MSLHFIRLHGVIKRQQYSTSPQQEARGKICHFVLKEDISIAEAICSVQLNCDMVDGRTGNFLWSRRSWYIWIIRKETWRGTNSNPACQSFSLEAYQHYKLLCTKKLCRVAKKVQVIQPGVCLSNAAQCGQCELQHARTHTHTHARTHAHTHTHIISAEACARALHCYYH